MYLRLYVSTYLRIYVSTSTFMSTSLSLSLSHLHQHLYLCSHSYRLQHTCVCTLHRRLQRRADEFSNPPQEYRDLMLTGPFPKRNSDNYEDYEEVKKAPCAWFGMPSFSGVLSFLFLTKHFHIELLVRIIPKQLLQREVL